MKIQMEFRKKNKLLSVPPTLRYMERVSEYSLPRESGFVGFLK